MNDGSMIWEVKQIQKRIYTIRDVQVMLDRDLAILYGVETRVLNQAVKRNMERFPEKFMFQLTEKELDFWKSQIVISNKEKMGLRKFPFAFTEQGVAMLSAVLRSEIAVQVSVQIIDAFVQMRRFIASNAAIFERINAVERKQIEYKAETETKFKTIFDAIERREIKPKQGIFFDGQIFDAYQFITDLIRSAKKSIILIDNYIDDTVLTLFSKRNKGVTVTILTQQITKQLSLDVEKFNAQYAPIVLKKFSDSHDRFLLIDDKDLYHFGASLKDLGKKWFAFSRFDKDAVAILNRLNSVLEAPPNDME
ncbi:MAG: ORF6N domain-containing protein [Candidatus Cloacimonetes bacterium]|nr:ORF6N domain-containing protein [Candidatus Cloacimonadota bacterium]